MNKRNLQLGALIVVPLLILGGIGLFFYRMYAEIKATQAEVKATAALIEQKFNLGTSTAPLVQLGSNIVTNNFAALCILSNNSQICQAAGINPQATPAPSPEK
jgi:hypothetical protein